MLLEVGRWRIGYVDESEERSQVAKSFQPICMFELSAEKSPGAVARADMTPEKILDFGGVILY